LERERERERERGGERERERERERGGELVEENMKYYKAKDQEHKCYTRKAILPRHED